MISKEKETIEAQNNLNLSEDKDKFKDIENSSSLSVLDIQIEDSKLEAIKTNLKINANSIDEQVNKLMNDFFNEFEYLNENPKLEHIKFQIIEIFSNLKISKSNENDLSLKCLDLQKELRFSNSKLNNIIQDSEQDKETIKSLKRDIANYMNLIEESNEKQRVANNNVAELEKESRNLNKIAEEYSINEDNNKNKIQFLLKEKDKLEEEKDQLGQNIEELLILKDELEEKLLKLEYQKKIDESEYNKLKSMHEENVFLFESELNRNSIYEIEITKLKSNILQREKSLKEEKEVIGLENEKMKELLEELKSKKFKNIYNELKTKFEKNKKVSENQYKEQVLKNSDLKTENKVNKEKLNKSVKELVFYKWLKASSDLTIQRLHGEVIKSNDRSLILEGKLNALKAELSFIKIEIDKYNKKANFYKQGLESLYIQSRKMNKNIHELASSNESHKDVLKQNEYEKQFLSKEIIGQQKELQLTSTRMKEMQIYQQKLVDNLNAANQKYLHSIGVLKEQELIVKESDQQILELSNNLKKQKGLNEIIWNNKNNFSNQIAQKHNEILELKSKITIVTRDLETKKYNLNDKNSVLNNLNNEIKKFRNENEILKIEFKKTKKNIEDLEKIIAKQKLEIKGLDNKLMQFELERSKFEDDYLKNIKEKDILNKTLYNKSDEIKNLLEKIRIQEQEMNSALQICKDKYKDLEKSKKENLAIKIESNNTKKKVNKIQNITVELNIIQKQLIQEKIKSSILSQEIKKPTRVHKMRIMEITEPLIFEMTMKMRYLQKQLIDKNKQLIIKDKEIEEKEKLVYKLESCLEKVSGNEIIQNINVTKQELNKKTNEIKSLMSELTEYRTQVITYKDEIQRLAGNNFKLRKKKINQKQI